jgi:hypothetical protein
MCPTNIKRTGLKKIHCIPHVEIGGYSGAIPVCVKVYHKQSALAGKENIPYDRE